ncbi:MAG: nucleotidyltransferase family protein [Bacteroidetes bacterium]|nr:nucleotidyltransferase family protein [Bacteroidota bacterium]
MNATKSVAIILAGGLGTRLRSVISDLPKPMAPVNGKPFLHYIFQYLAKNQISETILSVGYKHETIKEYFGEEYLGIKIRYSIEEEPLGTGGGIKKAFDMVQDEAYVLNGDTFFDVDLSALRNFYFQSNSDLVLSLKKLSNFDRYGTVELDANNRVTEFCEKKFMTEGLVNGGVYFFRKNLFAQVEVSEKFSFEKDVLEKYSSSLKFSGKAFDGYFIDIGIPEDYQKAQHEFK